MSALLLSSLFAKEPVPVIFDTDMGNDIDDAMALAMIHNMEKRGALELLAVTSTKDHPKSVAYIDALNTFYGQPDIAIGAVRNGMAKEIGRYLGLADETNNRGQLRYPHDLMSGENVPEAVSLIRETLASQPDQSVTIVQVGFFTNMARLIDSQPDEHSPLTGSELIRRKVKSLVIMAGAFETIRYNTRHLEYNVRIDVPSAQHLATNWPTEIIWSGFEIGIAAAYPWQSIQEDFEYVTHHIIKEGYLAYVPEHPHDRPTWDLTAVLAAVHPDRGYFDYSPAGTVTVEHDGATRFSPNETGLHKFLTMDEVQTARVREACVQLASEPPR